MKTLPLAEAKAKLSQLIDRVVKMDEQILITMIELVAIGPRRTIYEDTLRLLRQHP